MKRRDEVLVGVFTTTAVIVAVLGSIWLVRGGLSKGYPLYSRYTWGAGLKQGQPVWLSGVTVGFVDNVALDPHGTLVATYRIQKQYLVPKGTTSQVVPNGFFGDQAIALTPSTPNDTAFAPGDTVPVGPSTVGVSALLSRSDTMTKTLNKLLSATSAQLADSGGLAELRRTFVQSARLVTQLQEIAAVQSKEMQMTLAAFRRTANSIDSLQVDSTLRSLRLTSTNAAQLTADLRTTTSKLNTVLAKLESGDGTAGKLLNDPALYHDLRSLLNRVDSLTLDFKKNPRRYIDLRIF
jgi:phospholipid/cholesterol/gamma-HCH transport system substrate-binding protein